MKVRIDTKDFERLMQENSQLADRVLEDAYDYFVKTTPRRTGNARSNTTLDKDNNRIEAEYDYAEVLDKGRHLTSRGMRGSTQAPEGMTKPTMRELDRLVKKHLKDK